MLWEPRQYLHFADQRLRPALDLLARIDHREPRTVVDLGCGPGNVTNLLRQRWPNAAITGIDNSPEMLAAASKVDGITWQLADAADWRPEGPVDVLFSNAALHWLDGHRQLITRLAGLVNSGGTLAIQMPCNFAAPTHTIAADLVEAGSWRETLLPHLLQAPVHKPEEYYRMLAPLAAQVDVWETEYLHVLDGDDPVADWTRGSLLVPLLAALPAPERAAFGAEYRRRIRAAYPAEENGKTLLPFRRLFIVARV